MLGSELLSGRKPQITPGCHSKQRMLVVDDDSSIQKILYKKFSLMGYDVTLAGNGLEASTLFMTGCYDLVLTDFQMPLMNGWKLSQVIKEQSPRTPVILITGCGSGDDLQKLHATADAVIAKPFKLDEIGKAVKTLLSVGI